jgi:hypothetical protein
MSELFVDDEGRPVGDQWAARTLTDEQVRALNTPTAEVLDPNPCVIRSVN